MFNYEYIKLVVYIKKYILFHYGLVSISKYYKII